MFRAYTSITLLIDKVHISHINIQNILTVTSNMYIVNNQRNVHAVYTGDLRVNVREETELSINQHLNNDLWTQMLALTLK